MFVKIGKWKPYYFFVCAIVPGERTGPILFADPKNVLDADNVNNEDTNITLCVKFVWFGYSNITVLLSSPQQTQDILKR